MLRKSLNQFWYLAFLYFLSSHSFAQSDSMWKSMQLKKTIYGKISPKSIVHNGNGLFFAQNMFYNHSVTVYNRQHQLVKTISDKVILSDYGIDDREGEYKGAPVEAAFSNNGQYIWVTNYRMSGKGYDKPSYDTCIIGADCEKSCVYKISTSTFKIESVIETGCVPKYIAVSPDNQYVLVSNWCSGTVSIIDANANHVVREQYVGRYPRGIVVDSKSSKAYITLMGATDLAVLDLKTFELSFIKGVGSAPRHLCISPDDQFLYASINGQGKVVKINIQTSKVVAVTKSGKYPRSMVLNKKGDLLYIVNYKSHSVSKINTKDFSLVEEVKTAPYPIGITIDDEKEEIWVAGYTGTISIFKETLKKKTKPVLTEPVVVSAKELPKEKDSENYTVIVGSFSEPGNAERYIKELAKKGYRSFIVESGDRYRVGVGDYVTKEQALRALTNIRAKIHAAAWVTKVY